MVGNVIAFLLALDPHSPQYSSVCSNKIYLMGVPIVAQWLESN